MSFTIGFFRGLPFSGGFVVLFYLTPSPTLVGIYNGDHPEYAELYKPSLSDRDNQELTERLEESRREIHE